MESHNPVLSRHYTRDGYATFEAPADAPASALEQMYQAPSASPLQTGRMTLDDVVTRTGFLVIALVASAILTWQADLVGLVFPALILGMVLGFVNALSRKVRPALIVTYALVQGVVVGGISKLYNTMWDGIVTQAIMGTVAAFVGILVLYKSGRLRATPKFTRVLLGATLGYIVLGFVNLLFALFGGWNIYDTGGLGLLVSGAGVVLASLFLVLDFDSIEQGVRAGVPQQEAWRAGFGLLVTMVWLYLEILRFLAILRGND
jgi:uncharacterized YccA/Bax inhibitor family protein